MRVLVTGGAGFIGFHVSLRLLEEGNHVAVLDDINDYYDPALKETNLRDLQNIGLNAIYRIDICDSDGVMEAFQEWEPELVIHLAARAGVRPSKLRPLLYERVNVGGSTIILEAARTTRVRRVVFASSSSVYGSTDGLPCRESAATSAASVYAATKIAGEHLCEAYTNLCCLSAVCLRFFTVYGPRQRPDLAIRKFTEQIVSGGVIPMYGDGLTARDYTYVEDVVDGILAAGRHECTFDVFNLGNSSPVTLRAMISQLEDILGRRAHIHTLPRDVCDVPYTCADIGKAASKLGYCPRIPFAIGLERFVEWFVQPGRGLRDSTVMKHR